MKETAVVYIGIDVSKGTLDIDAGGLGATKVANAPAEIRRELKALAREAQGKALHACLESTGRYGDALVAECRRAGVACSVLNPSKVACFAKSVAHAKTDALDAALIRRYAETRRPEPTPAPSEAAAALGELALARDAAVKSAVALRSALDTLACASARKPMGRLVAAIEGKVAEYDRLIAEAVEADAETAGLVGALSSVKGVGTLTAAKVAAWMPEIGTLGRRKAAALAGLAPRTRESGLWKGRAFIGGGRKGVRDALFMPATVAIRFDPHMRLAHGRLMARGKPYKVALAAVMRQLVCRLDGVARDYRATLKESPGQITHS
ncbi:MAG: IS110 family transposase [Kiritimatiellaeota bacterium]|nr:IS110 family transposase [Kiritimatiellota bacterium]